MLSLNCPEEISVHDEQYNAPKLLRKSYSSTTVAMKRARNADVQGNVTCPLSSCQVNFINLLLQGIFFTERNIYKKATEPNNKENK